VVTDTAGKWPCLEDVTIDFMYLRLHGDKQLCASGNTEAALDRWADRIAAWSRAPETLGLILRPQSIPSDAAMWYIAPT
jgi:uncharacterized protein YecE (DUF72 family)